MTKVRGFRVIQRMKDGSFFFTGKSTEISYAFESEWGAKQFADSIESISPGKRTFEITEDWERYVITDSQVLGTPI